MARLPPELRAGEHFLNTAILALKAGDFPNSAAMWISRGGGSFDTPGSVLAACMCAWLFAVRRTEQENLLVDEVTYVGDVVQKSAGKMKEVSTHRAHGPLS